MNPTTKQANRIFEGGHLPQQIFARGNLMTDDSLRIEDEIPPNDTTIIAAGSATAFGGNEEEEEEQ